ERQMDIFSKPLVFLWMEAYNVMVHCRHQIEWPEMIPRRAVVLLKEQMRCDKRVKLVVCCLAAWETDLENCSSSRKRKEAREIEFDL
ncbi:unnamed protein product, partial [Gadus morhua 'NCC']